MFGPFDLSALERLGGGGESQVYALDAARVLRVYKPGDGTSYLARRHAFYALLRSLDPPFETPDIFEASVFDGRHHVVERRMRGRDFAAVLPNLRGQEREQALASYLHIAGQIGSVALPDRPFGELIRADDDTLQAETWPKYLLARIDITLAVSYAALEADVLRLEAVLARLHDDIRTLTNVREPRLVHGDYFPGNVFIDGLAICGVGDFGYTTLAGDPRMDLAGALGFLELVDSYQPEDTALLLQLLRERGEPELLPILDLYRRYYAVYFSGCKHDDPRTYAWCVRTLRGEYAPIC
jgi:Ser/Thr protein kinase RdoA (MazF antagonist)